MTEILAIGISINVNNGAVSSVSLVKCLKVSDVPSCETKLNTIKIRFVSIATVYNNNSCCGMCVHRGR